jgi:CheY-like chemotaxis protein/HPt (histidine-containing phosphotransfer) domain-containing protein
MERQLGILGLTAEFAGDGRAALERWRTGGFALLFTDLRMPELDGYGLTAAIRAEETGGQRTTIIALTANALPEESARCRAAGMDDYLVKPVRLPRLKAAIEKWLGPSRRHSAGSGASPALDESAEAGVLDSAPDAAATASTPADGPVDLRILVSLVGDDPEATRSVLAKFRSSAERLSGELHHAIRTRQPQAAAVPAHTLKSGARAIGAQRLGDLCARIEEIADAPVVDHESLAPLSAQFQTELEAVFAFLDAK